MRQLIATGHPLPLPNAAGAQGSARTSPEERGTRRGSGGKESWNWPRHRDHVIAAAGIPEGFRPAEPGWVAPGGADELSPGCRSLLPPTNKKPADLAISGLFIAPLLLCRQKQESLEIRRSPGFL